MGQPFYMMAGAIEIWAIEIAPTPAKPTFVG